jgi:hypothetical protein
MFEGTKEAQVVLHTSSSSPLFHPAPLFPFFPWRTVQRGNENFPLGSEMYKTNLSFITPIISSFRAFDRETTW